MEKHGKYTFENSIEIDVKISLAVRSETVFLNFLNVKNNTLCHYIA